ncbi:type IV pilin protein [Variovorax dokdonensis]|uniref:Type IV pilin protein n=1 Tax=Variovorax dokdonensis TaxID=344883 RepID=A0ABT7N9L8_9BURK|nr:type IV pilin protein [Variovorax dokdonensis]MDM0044641.1 type IV pilin protein [Variovorax dokdonensis]
MDRPATRASGAMRCAALRGFTLIEVMVTVAIVAILATVAYPNYTDYIRRGHVQEAPANLMTFRARMEQYYQDHRSYGSGSTCGVAVPASPDAEYFSYACTLTNSGQAYTATATGTGGTVAGLSYSIDQKGTRSSACSGCAWNFGTEPDIWVLRKP